MAVPVGKVCSTCKTEQDIENFARRTASPDGLAYICRACQKLKSAAHYQANKANWPRQEPAAAAARSLAYYYANRERKIKENNARARRNPEQQRAYKRAWAARNPDKVRVKTLRRVARKRGAQGSYTAHDWRALLDCLGHECGACGAEWPLTQDHVLPLALGGDNTIDNMQPLCGPCNSRKRDRCIDYRDPDLMRAFLAMRRGV